MKTRDGFVSNSSSSSFVVAMDSQRPTRDEVLAKFGRATYDSYRWMEEKSVPMDVTDYLVQDAVAMEGVPLSPEALDQIIATLFEDESLWYELVYETEVGRRLQDMQDKWADVWRTKDLTEEEARRRRRNYNTISNIQSIKADQLLRAKVSEWVKANEGKYGFKFHYSDNDGEVGAALEHGDHWEHAEALHFSHH
jgi:hypothetical protein